MCRWTNSGGASRPGTRSHPGIAHPSTARTLTNGPPFSRRPMLTSSRCSTPHRTQTEPLRGGDPVSHQLTKAGNDLLIPLASFLTVTHHRIGVYVERRSH